MVTGSCSSTRPPGESPRRSDRPPLQNASVIPVALDLGNRDFAFDLEALDEVKLLVTLADWFAVPALGEDLENATPHAFSLTITI